MVLRTVRACGDTFPAILRALEDGLAEFVAFDGELGGCADARAERPFCAAGGPHCHDGSGWICTFAEPVAGAVAQWDGAEEAIAVGGCGRDLAFSCWCDGDGVHGSGALLAR
jgi:hypothetical protein